MRASSSWIKLQFVVRKHVMNTYQMHTLSLFLFYYIFLFFCLFDSHPHLSRLISSLLFWWSVILMWHIQLYCIIHPFKCTCVCICVHILTRAAHSICMSGSSRLCQVASACADLSTIVFDVPLSDLITGRCGDALIWRLYRRGPGALEWAGADQDTFKLLLAAWANFGGDNPSGAVKTNWNGGGGCKIKMALK